MQQLYQVQTSGIKRLMQYQFPQSPMYLHTRSVNKVNIIQ